MKTTKSTDMKTVTQAKRATDKTAVVTVDHGDVLYRLTEKTGLIRSGDTLQTPKKGLGAEWRKAGHKAPSVRHNAIAALAAVANSHGIIAESDALQALKSVSLGTGTPRSFIRAFVANGYLAVVAE